MLRVDRILKMTLKSLTEANFNQEILEKEVIDLENIATELSKRKETDAEANQFEYNENEDTEIQIDSNSPIVKCDPC